MLAVFIILVNLMVTLYSKKMLISTKAQSLCKQCLHDLHFLKKGSFSPKLSKKPELTSAVILWKQDPCAELFTQWMDFSILSIVFLGITKSQLGPSQSTISISAKYCSFESRQGSRIRAANPSKCSSINQVSKALERLLGWI